MKHNEGHKITMIAAVVVIVMVMVLEMVLVVVMVGGVDGINSS